MPTLLNPAATDRLRLNLACEIEEVRPVALEARSFLAAHGVTENELMACELALVEACNNAVLYSIPSRKLDPIEVVLRCDDVQVEMEIHDHTAGFELPQKVELTTGDAENGRGLFIIQSLMDEVRYTGVIGDNTLFLRKKRSKNPEESTVTARALREIELKLAESEQIIDDMAEELSSCYESLSAIFRSGAELGKTRDLHEFSRSLCETLLQINSADWFLLRIAPNDGAPLKTYASSTNIELTPLSADASAIEASAERKAAAFRNDIWFSSKNPLHQDDPLLAMPATSIGLVHPIFFADELIGTLTLGKTTSERPFTVSNINVVHTVADFLGMQVVNARLYDEQLKHRLVTRELEIAQSIQRALLPKKLPQLAGFGLAGYCQSARHVGGDFYDAVQIDQTSALLMVADVMGKGVPAAMFAAILRSVLRGAPELVHHPAALLTRVNRLLFEDLSEVEMFITAQLAYVNVQSRELIFASAGHCPALLFCGTDGPKTISPEGMPLGVLQDTLFTDTRHLLCPGCRLVMFTDGVTESRNSRNEFFGEKRLMEWMIKTNSPATTADALKNSLAEELNRFQQNETPNDDQTFLILAEETLNPTL